MHIFLLCSAFNGLSQRFFVELTDAGHHVTVEVFTGDDALEERLAANPPDIIVAPFLKRAIPDCVWQRFRCFILHPGIVGDRGPSSLDWAILEGWHEWGVTLLEANAVMDAGNIWATRTFPLPPMAKSQIYRHRVTDAAVACLWELIEKLQRGQQHGAPLDYSRATTRGRERAMLPMRVRTLDWQCDPTDLLLRKIRASDSLPGAPAQLAGVPVRVFNAWQAEAAVASQRGRAGEIFARDGDALCVATLDGALWIGHLRRSDDHACAQVKLPAAVALRDELAAYASLPVLDARHPNKPWLETRGRVAILHFPLLNGAFTVHDSQILTTLFARAAADSSVDAIVLAGGDDFWSNGIELNSIHVADNPAEEGWASINAIDDFAEALLTCRDKLVVSAVNANAGAGGAMLTLAADRVFMRAGVVINPHYKTMGLNGSEFWTLTLPWRATAEAAVALSENCLPVSARKAAALGLVDVVLDLPREAFLETVVSHVNVLIAPDTLADKLQAKQRAREAMRSGRPLDHYRREELGRMRGNFFADDLHFSSRRTAFVMKQPPCGTPEHLQRHNAAVIASLAGLRRDKSEEEV
ncbi:hydrogenase maturation protein [Kosakonia sp. SMBL-WEM22]|uniref:enoyl-CoA hydratase-related protein n=1 Tax=Kosakonia sp. SMBL-WEM22 TaxID=2725560 RepID=UPI0016597828|nr:enoyl-CoA hydratase-related protein [Kosakonia sp. SMBL-WEM22]QNQ19911.1 hydrogenase maturation protein [Kosakonia sp. SMBL-WEM22]